MKFPSLLCPFCLSLLLLACDQKELGSGGSAPTSSSSPTGKSQSAKSKKIPKFVELPADSQGTAAPENAALPGNAALSEDAATPPAEPEPIYESESTRFVLGDLADLGPAAPIAASERGVYFIARNDRLFLAERKGESFVGLEAPPEYFYRFGAGPALTTTHAYWTNRQNQLLRGNLKTGEVQMLFEGALGNRRLSALRSHDRDLVAFMKQEGDRVVGMLWAEGDEVVRLSPEGAQATSIRLVPGKPYPHAVFMEGRMNMTPVHVRTLRVTKKRVNLTPDEVIWVGPGSSTYTEIFALDQPNNHAMAFLPTARDIRNFGIAHFDVDPRGVEVESPTWLPFKNGIDPAPVAGGHFCGSDWLVFSRPSEERPRSPQELRIAELKDGKVKESELLVRSRAINEVSLSPLGNKKEGAILAWTADHRSWARVLGCPPPR